jgi:hemoglobin
MKKKFSLIALSGFFIAATALAQETEAQEPTLYERLGGEAAITKVVDDFVARTSVNPAVNFTRRGTPREWQATPENVVILKKRLVEFIGTVTGGPQNYQGRDMKVAHQGMEITHAEFDALAGDLKASLTALNVPFRETTELLKIAETTRGSIVEIT